MIKVAVGERWWTLTENGGGMSNDVGMTHYRATQDDESAPVVYMTCWHEPDYYHRILVDRWTTDISNFRFLTAADALLWHCQQAGRA